MAEGTSSRGNILRTTPSEANTLPKLRDLDQPFLFNIKMYNRPYRFEFYDTASPESYTLLRPDFLILCYDISRRPTLYSLGTDWKATIEGHFNYDEQIPVLLLGLKRDLRKEWTQEERDAGRLGESVMPQEGMRVAQEMRCDRYAECSAVTGELCREVLEDIARVAAKTTTDKGGRTEGTTCLVM
jgi:Ras family protein A